MPKKLLRVPAANDNLSYDIVRIARHVFVRIDAFYFAKWYSGRGLSLRISAERKAMLAGSRPADAI